MLVALGIDFSGHKRVLGLEQGASENQTVCDGLLADLAKRGFHFDQPCLYVIDGGKALRGAVRKYGGSQASVQRCQLHKRRNVCGHLAEEAEAEWDGRLAEAYALPS